MEISKELNDKLRKILESANDVIFDVYHIQDYSDTPQDIEEHVIKIRNAGKKIETLATKILDVPDINVGKKGEENER